VPKGDTKFSQGKENEKNLGSNILFFRSDRSCSCGQRVGPAWSPQTSQRNDELKMRMLLNWIDDVMCRWTQHEMERFFEGVDPDSIQDIEQFLRNKGWN